MGFLIILFVTCLSSLMSAGLNKRIDSLEQEIASLKKETAPPQGALLEAKNHIDIAADYLYWKPYQQSIYFAFTHVQSRLDVFAVDVVNGKLARPTLHWDNGFRVAGRYFMQSTGWDWNLAWTHYSTDAKKTVNADALGFPGAVWASPSSQLIDFQTSASGKWEMDLNTLDLEMAFSFKLIPHLVMRPYAGLRGAWLPQQITIVYNFINYPPDSLISNVTWFHEKITSRTKFFGIGPRFGWDLQLKMGYGLSVNANAAAAFLYGMYSNALHEKGDKNGAFPAAINLKDHINIGKWTAQGSLGLQYDTPTFAKDKHLTFKLAWEHNFWFGINKCIRHYDIIQEGLLKDQHGDLTLQGLTATALFEF